MATGPPPLKRKPDVAVNRLLAVVGVALLAVAAVGLILERSAALVGGFLVVGGALTLASAFVSRLEGAQELGLTGAKFNIAVAAEVGEAEVKTGQLLSLEELSSDQELSSE
jgi:hypothetical protein